MRLRRGLRDLRCARDSRRESSGLRGCTMCNMAVRGRPWITRYHRACIELLFRMVCGRTLNYAVLSRPNFPTAHVSIMAHGSWLMGRLSRCTVQNGVKPAFTVTTQSVGEAVTSRRLMQGPPTMCCGWFGHTMIQNALQLPARTILLKLWLYGCTAPKGKRAELCRHRGAL